MSTTTNTNYSTNEVSRLVGVTVRQLDHWLRTGAITREADEEAFPGTGFRRQWSETEVRRLKSVVAQYNDAVDTIKEFRSGRMWRVSR